MDINVIEHLMKQAPLKMANSSTSSGSQSALDAFDMHANKDIDAWPSKESMFALAPAEAKEACAALCYADPACNGAAMQEVTHGKDQGKHLCYAYNSAKGLTDKSGSYAMVRNGKAPGSSATTAATTGGSTAAGATSTPTSGPAATEPADTSGWYHLLGFRPDLGEKAYASSPLGGSTLGVEVINGCSSLCASSPQCQAAYIESGTSPTGKATCHLYNTAPPVTRLEHNNMGLTLMKPVQVAVAEKQGQGVEEEGTGGADGKQEGGQGGATTEGFTPRPSHSQSNPRVLKSAWASHQFT